MLTVFELYLHFVWLGRGLTRIRRHLVESIRSLFLGVLQNSGFVADVHHVGIDAPRSLRRHWQGNMIFLQPKMEKDDSQRRE